MLNKLIGVSILYLFSTIDTLSMELSFETDANTLIAETITEMKDIKDLNGGSDAIIGNNQASKLRCIWLPQIRHKNGTYCSQRNIAIFIDSQAIEIKLRLKMLPIYSVEEGCAYHTKKTDIAWEKCVSTDIKSIYYIFSSMESLSLLDSEYCIHKAKDNSTDVSYQLRYNTIAKCLSSRLKVQNSKLARKLDSLYLN